MTRDPDEAKHCSPGRRPGDGRRRPVTALATGVLALGLVAAPATMDLNPVGLDAKSAFAGRGGGGGNGGGGNGGGNGGGGGNSGGGDRSDRSDRGDRGGGHGVGGRAGGNGYGRDRAGGGHGFGDRGHRDGSGFANARGRYNEVAVDGFGAGRRGGGDRGRDAGLEHEVGAPAHALSRAETAALMERGWRGKAKAEGGFRNHGERVRTMVELSKRLGYGARVGAMQANFGTPQENGIADLQEALADARASQTERAALDAALAEAEAALAAAEAELDKVPTDAAEAEVEAAEQAVTAARAEVEEAKAALDSMPDVETLAAEVEGLEADLAAAIDAAKPGQGPDDSWATADLDVNGDAVVDGADLEALDSAPATGGEEDEDGTAG